MIVTGTYGALREGGAGEAAEPLVGLAALDDPVPAPRLLAGPVERDSADVPVIEDADPLFELEAAPTSVAAALRGRKKATAPAKSAAVRKELGMTGQRGVKVGRRKAM
jgi:hypothetical protein